MFTIINSSRLMIFVYYFSIFLFLFGWKIDTYIDLMLIVSAVFSLNIKIYKERLTYFMVFPLIAMTLVHVLSNGLVYDDQFVLRTIRSIINVTGIVGFVLVYERFFKTDQAKVFVNVFVQCVTFHALIIILMTTNDVLRAHVYDFTGARDIVNYYGTEIEEGFRITGLTYGLAITSIFHLTALLLLVKKNCGTQPTPSAFLTITLNLIALLFLSKTAILLTGMFCGFLLVKYLISGNYDNKFINYFVVMLALILLFFISVNWFYESYRDTMVAENFPFLNFINILNHSFYAYFLLFTEIDFVQPYVDHYLEMIILPQGMMNWILGVGTFGRGEVYIPSDIGYIRFIFAVGIVGCCIALIPFISALFLCVKHPRYGDIRDVLLFVTVLTLIFNFKEVSIFTRGIWDLFLFSWTIFIFSLSQKNKRFEERSDRSM